MEISPPRILSFLPWTDLPAIQKKFPELAASERASSLIAPSWLSNASSFSSMLALADISSSSPSLNFGSSAGLMKRSIFAERMSPGSRDIPTSPLATFCGPPFK